MYPPAKAGVTMEQHYKEQRHKESDLVGTADVVAVLFSGPTATGGKRLMS